MFIDNILSNNFYVYQSWENLGTRTGVISVIYKKGDIQIKNKKGHI